MSSATDVKSAAKGGGSVAAAGSGDGVTSSLSDCKFVPEVKALEPQLIAWRRHLHQYPETSFQEFETAKYIAAQLRGIDAAAVAMERQSDAKSASAVTAVLTIWEKIGKTGVVAVLKGGAGPGPCIALRCDMDGLPITEADSAINAPYKSKNVGVMHACGHDGHMSMMLGAVHVLVAQRKQLRGSVKFIFQPAEEGFAGAAAMLADGVLDEGKCGPKVDELYGLHVWNYMNVGTVGVKSGPLMAASDRFGISVKGKGGHGAIPQGTNDCIVAGVNVVQQLHTIVARNINPIDSAVLTVGQFNAGYAPNVIADAATLTGTVRTFNPGTRQLIIERMHNVVDGTAKSFGVSAELSYHEGYPCVDNTDARGVERVKHAALRVVPKDFLLKPESTMGAEDVSFLLRAVGKGCFFFLGCSLQRLSAPLCSAAHVDGPCSSSVTTGEERPHHRSDFDFDERVLCVGASIWVRLIDDVLGPAATGAAAPSAAAK